MIPGRLQALLAVPETGSISRAARREGATRAALTRRFDELEEEAGVVLLQRSKRGVVPTDAGRALLTEAPALIRRAHALRGEFQAPDQGPARWRIAAPIGLAPPVTSLLVRTMSRFLGSSRFEVVITEDPLSLLGHGVELALVFGPKLPEGPWRTTSFGRLEERLAASPSNLAKWGRPQSLDELGEHRLLLQPTNQVVARSPRSFSHRGAPPRLLEWAGHCPGGGGQAGGDRSSSPSRRVSVAMR